MLGRIAAIFGVVFSVWIVSADEPIMNMMPRWDNGWGLQLINEYRHEDDLLLGSRTTYSGFTEDVHLLHFQGYMLRFQGLHVEYYPIFLCLALCRLRFLLTLIH